MRYNKIVWLLALSLLFTGVSAETIVEDSFQDLGFAGFENNDANSTHCEIFSFFKDLNQNTAEFYTIVSLHVLFEPVVSADANLTVFLNDRFEPVATAKATELKSAWYRAVLPRKLLWEENTIQICLSNSLSTTRSELLADSLYGTYKMAEFKEADFTKTVSNLQPQIKQEFAITVSLHNSGSETADVNVLYRKPGIGFEHLPFVKGQSNFVGRVQPNKTISFTYSIKATKTGPFTLPAAALFFENGFGEVQELVSNYPAIKVLKPEIIVSAVVLNQSTQKKLLVGKAIPLQLVLTNNGQTEITNIAPIFPEIKGLHITQPQSQSIALLKPGESRFIDYNVVPLQAGKFESGCRIAYQGLETGVLDCQPTRFLVEESSFPIEFMGGIALIIIAVLVYLYYHFR